VDRGTLSRITISSESSLSAPLSTSVVDARVGTCMGAILIVPFPFSHLPLLDEEEVSTANTSRSALTSATSVVSYEVKAFNRALFVSEGVQGEKK
jgi:hypothetical protein